MAAICFALWSLPFSSQFWQKLNTFLYDSGSIADILATILCFINYYLLDHTTRPLGRLYLETTW